MEIIDKLEQLFSNSPSIHSSRKERDKEGNEENKMVWVAPEKSAVVLSNKTPWQKQATLGSEETEDLELILTGGKRSGALLEEMVWWKLSRRRSRRQR